MTELENLENVKVTEDLNINHPLGRDEFLYDLIGINLMGLKSLGTLIKNPQDYFKAALSPDWEGRHWPSMRMWFGLMTIMIALQFIWASESSEMTAMFRMLAGAMADGINAGAPEGEKIDFSSFDRVEAGKRMFKNWIFIYPFFFVAFMCLLGFIFRGWERKLPYIARVRFIFAIIVPGTIIGLLSTFAMLPFKGTTYQIFSMVSLGLVFLVYWITAYRGAYAHCDKGTRLGMSFIISLLILITLLIAQTISMALTVVPIIGEVVDIVKAQRPPK